MKHDLIDFIRHIELYTKRLMKMNGPGDARSKIKGTGLEFEQLRDYYSGDDVRAIDWNSSARHNKLLIKQFVEEKHRTIFIVLDISASAYYGSGDSLKYTRAAEIAAILACAAYHKKDSVGLLLFTDRVELYICPDKGKSHSYLIMQKILAAQPVHKKTNMANVYDYLLQLRKKNAMVFLISDFIDERYEQKLALVCRMYDTMAIRITDDFEQILPMKALISVQDIETGQEAIVNTRSIAKASILKNRLEQQDNVFMRYGIDMLAVNQTRSVVEQLVCFFNKRRVL